MKTKICAFLAVIMVFYGTCGVFASDNAALDSVAEGLAAYICDAVPNPTIGDTGGDWAVIGLARSGYAVPEGYFQKYSQNVEAQLEETGGILDDKKYTEYSRLILALTAIGKNPADVAGYNLLLPLGDYDQVVWQGINGPVWALIALDSGNYEIPQNAAAATQATRELYIAKILESQHADGGWALADGAASDPDVTAMALQALANYQGRADVQKAIDAALDYLSGQQNENGGFSSWGAENSESSAQVLIALCALGIPTEDARFVKNGNTVLDHLMGCYETGSGMKRTPAGDVNQMTTEQGFLAVVAAQRMLEGKPGLYCMDDTAAIVPDGDAPAAGLPGKHTDVHAAEVREPGKTFADISAHPNKAAIEALAERGIINGMDADTFAPDMTMTRAEFAAIAVNALGLPIVDTGVFSDVPAEVWFAPYVNTAYAYGIVSGVSDTAFNPDGTITRQEAAAMVARGAGLCGMDTQMDAFSARDVLAGFIDYVEAADWAYGALAFCYQEGILPDDAIEILPQQPVTRAEIAQMLYNLLNRADLL